MNDLIDLIETSLANSLRRRSPNGTPRFAEAEKLTDLLLPELIGQQQERFAGLFLVDNSQPAVFENLFVGCVENTAVELDEPFCDEILGPILRHQAADLIVIHYHPEGDGCLQPLDHSVVQWLIQTLAALDMRILAYFVLTGEGGLSFVEI